MTDIITLVPDIYKLLEEGKEPDEANLEVFARNLTNTLRRRLFKQETDPTLRMSNIGKPDRQLWYELNYNRLGLPREKLEGHTLFKFLYGDIIEETLLLLAKEAGHTVEDEQREVVLEGIKGHIDAKIDGVVVDVKSTSKYAFKKFEDGTLAQDDPFGYIDQLSGYASTEEYKGSDAAFLAANKELGTLALLTIPARDVEQRAVAKRAVYVKEMVKQKTPPKRCYDAVPEGKSGNMKLDTGCSYCAFKEECWKDANGGKGLRTFLYSTGPVYMTQVEKEPKVMEVT